MHYRPLPAVSGTGNVPDRQRELQRSDRTEVARPAARHAPRQAQAHLARPDAARHRPNTART